MELLLTLAVVTSVVIAMDSVMRSCEERVIIIFAWPKVVRIEFWMSLFDLTWQYLQNFTRQTWASLTNLCLAYEHLLSLLNQNK